MKKKNFLFTVGICFLFIFVLNYLTTYATDDFSYRFVFDHYGLPTDNPEKITGFFSIVRSMWRHYFAMNGRWLAHSFVQFFMSQNKLLFDFFNSIFFLLLGWLLNYLASLLLETENDLSNLSFIYPLLWLSLPEFGKSVLWLSGACNYLWMSLVYLSYLLVFKKINKYRWYNVFLLIGLGILSGATGENSGAATVIVVFLLWLFTEHQPKKLMYWKLISVMSSAISSIILIKSPGALKIESNLSILTSNFFTLIKFSLLLIVPILLSIYFLYKLSKANVFESCHRVFLFIFVTGALASFFSLVFAEHSTPRNLFSVAIYLNLMLVYLLYLMKDYFEKKRPFMINTVLTLVSLVIYIPVTSQLAENYLEYEQEIAVIEQTKREHKKLAVVQGITWPDNQLVGLYNPYYKMQYLSSDSHAWLNEWMSKFYTVKGIRLEKK
ncbi:hypothetical protein RV11_GL003202 [Enterococcus phoeniculicola]|nr:DUF6056 family protein [Enterococcus phoeniculicola]OJG72231.1 hypothetical protein RV11_GL003202 [Enterococcus phoeniculicola]